MIHIIPDFWIPQLERKRTIRIYLPDDYFNSTQNYPVIYMQDGQNLFDSKTAYLREWKIAKTLDKITKGKKKQKSIVVGIDNGGIHRIDEYTPFRNKNLGGGQGLLYLKFIVETLKPFVDNHFRTIPNRNHTTIAGSSLGGLISIFGGIYFPQIFGKIVAFSPSLWFNHHIFEMIKTHYFPETFWYVVGSQTENRYMESQLKNIYWSFKKAGYDDENIRIIIRNRGKHNELFWGNEFRKMYEFLFLK